MTETDKQDHANELLRAAYAGASRCLAHGHRFDTDDLADHRQPVVVEKVDGKLEVWCLSCAEHYGENIYQKAADAGEPDQ